MKLHVVGIGGAGMRGIAEIAHEKGYIVTGSDLKSNKELEEMKNKGIHIFNNHSASNVKNANAIAISGAINYDNPELIHARLNNIPIWSRMQALDRLLDGLGNRISIIGSCGKTSATAILESVFNEAKPSVYMGAKSKITNKSGSLGDGRVSIIESCEYKGAFFDFKTDNIVLTDIVPNHEDYFGSGIDLVSKTFVNYIQTSLASNILLPTTVLNNEVFKEILHSKGVATYGIGSGQWQAEIQEKKGLHTIFRLSHNGLNIGDFTISIPGDHLVKHSIPAIALALEFGLSPNIIRDNLINSRLPNRRFDIKYQNINFIAIDDNARNPSQLDYTLSVLSDHLPDYKIIAIGGIWGHLNSRPIYEFAEVLRKANIVMIPELGRAAKSSGGAEDDNAIDTFIEELEKVNVIGEKGISKIYLYNKISELLKESKVALITFGYDFYSSDFNEIHSYIIDKME